MSKNNTGRKATRQPERLNYHGGDAVYTQHQNGDITLRLSGTITANLRKIADTMNGVQWCDNDNTPCTVLGGLLLFDIICNLADKGKVASPYACGIAEELDMLSQMIDTRAEGQAEDERRRELLDALFAAFN